MYMPGKFLLANQKRVVPDEDNLGCTGLPAYNSKTLNNAIVDFIEDNLGPFYTYNTFHPVDNNGKYFESGPGDATCLGDVNRPFYVQQKPIYSVIALSTDPTTGVTTSERKDFNGPINDPVRIGEPYFTYFNIKRNAFPPHRLPNIRLFGYSLLTVPAEYMNIIRDVASAVYYHGQYFDIPTISGSTDSGISPFCIYIRGDLTYVDISGVSPESYCFDSINKGGGQSRFSSHCGPIFTSTIVDNDFLDPIDGICTKDGVVFHNPDIDELGPMGPCVRLGTRSLGGTLFHELSHALWDILHWYSKDFEPLNKARAPGKGQNISWAPNKESALNPLHGSVDSYFTHNPRPPITTNDLSFSKAFAAYTDAFSVDDIKKTLSNNDSLFGYLPPNITSIDFAKNNFSTYDPSSPYCVKKALVEAAQTKYGKKGNPQSEVFCHTIDDFWCKRNRLWLSACFNTYPSVAVPGWNQPINMAREQYNFLVKIFSFDCAVQRFFKTHLPAPTATGATSVSTDVFSRLFFFNNDTIASARLDRGLEYSPTTYSNISVTRQDHTANLSDRTKSQARQRNAAPAPSELSPLICEPKASNIEAYAIRGNSLPILHASLGSPTDTDTNWSSDYFSLQYDTGLSTVFDAITIVNTYTSGPSLLDATKFSLAAGVSYTWNDVLFIMADENFWFLLIDRTAGKTEASAKLIATGVQLATGTCIDDTIISSYIDNLGAVRTITNRRLDFITNNLDDIVGTEQHLWPGSPIADANEHYYFTVARGTVMNLYSSTNSRNHWALGVQTAKPSGANLVEYVVSYKSDTSPTLSNHHTTGSHLTEAPVGYDVKFILGEFSIFLYWKTHDYGLQHIRCKEGYLDIGLLEKASRIQDKAQVFWRPDYYTCLKTEGNIVDFFPSKISPPTVGDDAGDCAPAGNRKSRRAGGKQICFGLVERGSELAIVYKMASEARHDG